MFGRRNTGRVVALLGVLLASSCTSFRTYTDAERQRHLKNGEVLSYLKRIEGTKLSIGESQAIINAPPARVWNFITDYNRQDEIGPRTEKIEITRLEGDTAWVDMVLNAPWPMEDAAFSLKVEHDRKNLRTNWSLVEGNIEESYGSWKIDPLPAEPERSLATYTLLYDDGSFMPRWVLNYFTRQAVRKVMVLTRQYVHDPIYDKPVYSISVLEPDSSRLAPDPAGVRTGHQTLAEKKELKLDEETAQFLR